MGAFLNNHKPAGSKLTEYAEVLRRRKDALAAVQSVSGELLEKLVSSDIEGLCETLEKRDKACASLAQAMKGAPELPSVISQARQSQKSSGDPESIIGLDDEFREILADVVEKQKQCEQLLKADIAKTVEQLKQSANRRNLTAAYGPANTRPQARFIDRVR